MLDLDFEIWERSVNSGIQQGMINDLTLLDSERNFRYEKTGVNHNHQSGSERIFVVIDTIRRLRKH